MVWWCGDGLGRMDWWMDMDGVVVNVLKIGYYYITKFYLLLMR